jgi:hypothetical protein
VGETCPKAKSFQRLNALPVNLTKSEPTSGRRI